MNLNKLAQKIYKINADNGWNILDATDWDDENKIPARLCLIHSEVSEALEAFRKNDMNNFKEEMADIVIRVLGACFVLSVNIEEEIDKKLEKNKKRGYRHGGKRI